MTILEELQKIEAKHGILRPEDVVEYAANKKTALHSQFTWDDSVAAHQYRLWQARKIITYVQITVPDTEPFQAFVSLTTDRQNGGGYRPMVTVMSNAEMREQLLADAIVELRLFKQKYQDLKELAGVFAAIEEAATKVKPRKRELAKA